MGQLKLLSSVAMVAWQHEAHETAPRLSKTSFQPCRERSVAGALQPTRESRSENLRHTIYYYSLFYSII